MVEAFGRVGRAWGGLMTLFLFLNRCCLLCAHWIIVPVYLFENGLLDVMVHFLFQCRGRQRNSFHGKTTAMQQPSVLVDGLDRCHESVKCHGLKGGLHCGQSLFDLFIQTQDDVAGQLQQFRCDLLSLLKRLGVGLKLGVHAVDAVGESLKQ